MAADFTTLRNDQERQVINTVVNLAPQYPVLTEQHLPDVVCVALNRLPPRYICHLVDLAFYQTEKDRHANTTAIEAAVRFACEFVQARVAMRARA